MASTEFSVTLPDSSLFLRLPFSIRRRIYILAGLVRFCPIDLNHEGARKQKYFRQNTDGWDHWVEERRDRFSFADIVANISCFYRNKQLGGRSPFPGPAGIDCVCGPLPLSLLLVNRAIHKEAVQTLYSENQFKICRSGPNGLGALFRLNRHTLSLMTSLHVQLNACGCVPNCICSIANRLPPEPFLSTCMSCHQTCKCGFDAALAPQDPRLPSLVREWEGLLDYLGQNLSPGRMTLSIVCDTTDAAAARQVLQTTHTLPLLASCAVRVGQRPTHSLRSLAETAVRRVTGQSSPTEVKFAWNDLPEELQLRILGFSSLVAPGPIHWSERDRLGMPICCGRCTGTLESCCCPRLHAAFTSASCTCWSWPSDYFLVSRIFRKQAVYVAYSTNSFSVNTVCGFQTASQTEGFSHRSALVFLQSIPRDALPYIRSLRIIFNGFTSNDLCLGTESQATWDETILFMTNHLSLPLLDLTLYTDEAYEHEDPLVDVEEMEWRFYQRMVRGAAALRKARSVCIVFPPVSDSGRMERNRARERELELQMFGHGFEGRQSNSGFGQGHPKLESSLQFQEQVFDPSGQRIWPM